jgi:pSer/pThr/pTyr-binding forkhead associated (FHA) protein
VPENLLTLLKLCLLALLYLFFMRVLWAVWNEVRAPKLDAAMATASTKASRKEAKQGKGKRSVPPTRLVVAEPLARKGTAVTLGAELTVGRATGCQLSIPDDTFVSQLHARVYQSDGLTYVEDLGSTNGTYVNGRRITAPSPLRRGDSVQIGATTWDVN